MVPDYNRQTMGLSRTRRFVALGLAVAAAGVATGVAACGAADPPSAPAPWILLITLDTTRADAMSASTTPAFDALAARGRRFSRAQATVPETLPSHTSIMTGLYPGGHGVHENGRHVGEAHPVLAAELSGAGYRTAAVVSSFVLTRRFGLSRGFDAYDDEWSGDRTERPADATTERALTQLQAGSNARPLFLWTHYFDAHAPYAPPAPFRNAFAETPYLGEVAFVDAQMARLVDAFHQAASAAGREAAIIVTADHGEGLGEHGEAQHGHLIYQSTMHVPLVVTGPGVQAGTVDTPVSTRRIYQTVLDFAGLQTPDSLRAPTVATEVVMGEGMKPFLQYGWQPQISAMQGDTKAILAGPTEVFDLTADPGELADLQTAATLPRPLREALDAYPVPSLSPTTSSVPMDRDAREKLASLGYVSATTAPVVRRDAPRPADMVELLPLIEQASTLFVREQYRDVIPVLQRILAADPNHLDATMRLATAYSALGRGDDALATFRRAQTMAPTSPDVPLYLALHYARGPEWARAVPLLEQVLTDFPERLPALEALALLRERQDRVDESLQLRRRVFALRPPTAAEAIAFGRAAMSRRQTEQAVWGFEEAARLQGAAFEANLDLGVLYQVSGRLQDAAQLLDRVPASHRDYPMALFKRAQVSVLLKEPDRLARIEAARRHADATTRALIANERLFK
jgi:arylsulfatase A-like enzyme/Flp pilus assembly protein TadD